MKDVKRIHEIDRYNNTFGTDEFRYYRKDILKLVDEDLVKEFEELLGTKAEFNRFGMPLIEIPYTVFGDYAGWGTVGKANYDWFMDNYADVVVECVDSLGTRTLLINLTKVDEKTDAALVSVFNALNDYPVVDDSYQEAVEDEIRDEWFDDEFGAQKDEAYRIYLRDNLYKEESFEYLTYYLPSEVIDKIHEELNDKVRESVARTPRTALREKASKKGILDTLKGKKVKREYISKAGDVEGVMYGTIEPHSNYYNFAFEDSDRQSRGDFKDMVNVTEESFDMEIAKAFGGGRYRYSLA